MTIARTRHLTFQYGGAPHPALVDVSCDIRAGEIVLVRGPSGSGKSTLLRALSGLVPHFHGGELSGEVHVNGTSVADTTVAELARVVGTVFQDPETQAVRATVRADVAFGPENLGVPADQIAVRVDEALDALDVGHLAEMPISSLSGGERQRVALAGVLACRPRIVLMDEPTSQLDDDGVHALDTALRRVAATGVAVVIAEHSAHRLAGAPDRVLALDRGRIVADHRMDSEWAPPQPSDPGAAVVDVHDLSVELGGTAIVRASCLTLHAGQVTVLSGPNGAGKSSLIRAIAGLVSPSAGSIRIDGVDATSASVESRASVIGVLLQDAGRRLLCESVHDELCDGVRTIGSRERRHRLRAVEQALDLTDLRDRHPLDLSVGERERVALGCVLMRRPRVLIADEPVRGVDRMLRRRLVDELRALAASGTAVLVATHDRDFATALGDVHLTMANGHVQQRSAEVVG